MNDLLSAWAQALATHILSHSTTPPLWVVADPQNLLQEPVNTQLAEQGWQVTKCTEPMALRALYEQTARAPQPPAGRFVGVLGFPTEQVPYDIGQACPPLSLCLTDFFTGLDTALLEGLPAEANARVWAALQQEPWQRHQRCTSQDTACLLLRVLWGISCSGTSLTPRDVFLLALQALTSDVFPPLPLLQALGVFQLYVASPLRQEQSWRSREDLRQALRQIWEPLGRIAAGEPARTAPGWLRDAQDWLADSQIQNALTRLLAAEELPPLSLKPSLEENQPSLPPWWQAGVHYTVDTPAALKELLAYLHPPGSEGRWEDWADFARHWARLRAKWLRLEDAPAEIAESLRARQRQAAQRLTRWLSRHYAVQLGYPATQGPATVAQVLPFLLHRHRSEIQRGGLALVVLDGMAWEDWLLLQPLLPPAVSPARQKEIWSVLAQVPTLTSWSRQALLGGRPANALGEDVTSTASEGAHWRTFWQREGWPAERVYYTRGLGVGQRLTLPQPLEAPGPWVATLIVNGVDTLMHKSPLVEHGFAAQLLAWAAQVGLGEWLNALCARFALVAIATDHGHIAGEGVLSPDLAFRLQQARLFSETTGLRALVAPRDALPPALSEALAPQLIPWRGGGLPGNWQVWFPSALSLLAPQGSQQVAHGGLSVEESIVPFILWTCHGG